MELNIKFRELERKHYLEIETIPNEYYDDLQEPLDFDTYFDELIESTYSIECIYYSRAMKYLSENDSSLTTSLKVAHEMGYEVNNINSELLATLLMQQNELDALYNAKDDLETLYDEFLEYKENILKEYEE